MAHDPLSPSEALRTRTGTAIAVVSVLLFAYSLVIVAQLLLGVMVSVALPIGLYLSYRTLAVLDSIADAAQRFADTRERETDEASRFGSATERDSATTDRDSSASRSTERISERER
jgi:hypothetical protein